MSNRWPKRSVETFFDSWNPDMAYILGYFASDGTMYRNKRGSSYIGFTSTDEGLISTVKRLMKVSNKIEVYKAKMNNWKLRFTLQIGSKKIFAQLLKLGFTPKKSLTLNYPFIPNQYLCHFFRGYFDGDGCASFIYYKRKDRKNPQKIFVIRIRCGSKKFIKGLQKQLAIILSAAKGRIHFHSGAYELVYSSKSVIKLYSFIYPTSDVPCLKRKRDILIKGLKAFNVGS